MYKKIRKSDPLIMTLCPRCLSQFFYTESYWIYRKDPFQVTRDDCCYCNLHRGYDYILYPRRSRSIRQSQNCRRTI